MAKKSGIHPNTPQTPGERQKQLARKEPKTIERLARNRGIETYKVSSADLIEKIVAYDFGGGRHA